MMRRSALLGLALLLVGLSGQYSFAALISNTSADGVADAGYFGQSFTTPAGGPFNNITFNWFSDTAATMPLAKGTLFLLSQAYTGTPNGLNSGVTGFVASSTSIASNVYQFATGTLLSSTPYFAYMDGSDILDSGTGFGAAFNSGGGYSGGDELGAVTSPTASYGSTTRDLAFVLGGSAISAVPEPSSFALLGMTLVGLLGYRRRTSNR